MIRHTLSAICMAVAGAGLAAAQPDPAAEPVRGETYLSSGFTPDPFQADFEAGGEFDASVLGGACSGSVAAAPEFGLYYNAGSFPLIISVNAWPDTTLVVHRPDGVWQCDNDSGEGTNPSVRIEQPQTGVYGIWVGIPPGPGQVPVTLQISELYSR